MFEHDSRYYQLEEAIYEDGNGRQTRYKRRRFLPQGETMPEVGRVTIQPHGRLDLIAAQSLGDPKAFWQICDANNALNPFDLVADTEIGRQLRIPTPPFQELP
ncbi:MAG: hypothetical protein KC441_14355 [Anaerolineales bacterium]|nr:hypothetical protein [Anaerolineales bacterium]